MSPTRGISGRQSKRPSCFVEWIPTDVKTSFCNAPLPGLKLSTAHLGNTTATGDTFQRVGTQFRAVFKRKAFLPWYTGEGVDEMEFSEAEANVSDLSSECRRCSMVDERGGVSVESSLGDSRAGEG
jgi:tubulin beta